MEPSRILHLPAERASRWLALRALEGAWTAWKRHDDAPAEPAPAELDDALRELAGTLRMFEESLRGTVRAGDRRRVRKLTRAVAARREANADRVAYEGIAEPHRGDAGAADAAVRARLDGAAERAHEELHQLLVRNFARSRKRLRKRLRAPLRGVTLEDPSGGPLAGEILAAHADTVIQQIAARLGDVPNQDHRSLRRALRAVLRLRELIAFAADGTPAPDFRLPLDALSGALERVVRSERLRLSIVQYGDEEDDRESERTAGVDVLLTAVEGERQAARAALSATWLQHVSAPVFAAAAWRRVLGQAPDVEIERKYLLRSMPQLPEGVRWKEIEQGWIPGERLAERLRRVRSAEGERWYRTIKLGRGITRTEVEEETTRQIFLRLWSLTRGRRVRKRRYVVPTGDLVWEIDRFRRIPLILAEVELASEDTEVVFPPWLAPHVVREVTGEDSFVNINLAR